jgi:hypothetical protein
MGGAASPVAAERGAGGDELRDRQAAAGDGGLVAALDLGDRGAAAVPDVRDADAHAHRRIWPSGQTRRARVAWRVTTNRQGETIPAGVRG